MNQYSATLFDKYRMYARIFVWIVVLKRYYNMILRLSRYDSYCVINLHTVTILIFILLVY